MENSEECGEENSIRKVWVNFFPFSFIILPTEKKRRSVFMKNLLN